MVTFTRDGRHMSVSSANFSAVDGLLEHSAKQRAIKSFTLHMYKDKSYYFCSALHWLVFLEISQSGCIPKFIHYKNFEDCSGHWTYVYVCMFR